jgi:hypothetical protein
MLFKLIINDYTKNYMEHINKNTIWLIVKAGGTLHTVTVGYTLLPYATHSYRWLYTVTAGYIQLPQATYSYRRLHTVTVDYTQLP